MAFITAPFVNPSSDFINKSSFSSRQNAPYLVPPTRHAVIRMQATPPEKPGPYKVGFCIAGAVTGGAYSAGVMDFLLEAMSAWEEKKKNPNPDPTVPKWDVAMTEIIGTSSGGINSVLAVNALNTDHQPLPRDYSLSPTPPESNSLFRVWVHEATYKNLLKTDDLDKQEPFKRTVPSFLCSDFMKKTIKNLLSPSVIHEHVPAWAKDLHLSLTATNLRGVPYSVQNFTDRQGGTSKYHMRKYADYTQFRVSLNPESDNQEETESENRTVYLTENRLTDETWNDVTDCARATSAFPAGFPTVAVKTPRSEYKGRFPRLPDWVATMIRAGRIHPTSAYEEISKIDEIRGWEKNALTAEWDEDVHKTYKTHGRQMYLTEDVERLDVKPNEEVFAYAGVDGGVCNNEPFGLLRKNMELRNKPGTLDVEPKDAWGSVILVDPFPSMETDPKIVEENTPLVRTIWSLANAGRGEASFKEDEISAALSTETMGRFMIAPKTISDPSQHKELATGELGTFAGILDPKIAYHDFVLGRRNCQYFLQNVFVMDREDAKQNPIFKDHLDNIAGDYIPIIPVVGSAKEEVQLPEWPAFEEQEKKDITKNVKDAIDKRLKKVLYVFMENLGIIKDYKGLGPVGRARQFAVRRAAYLIEGLLRDRLTTMAEEEIVGAMDKYTTKA